VKIPPAEPSQQRQNKNYEKKFSQANAIRWHEEQKRVSKLMGSAARRISLRTRHGSAGK
jgi:hypothetical protein